MARTILPQLPQLAQAPRRAGVDSRGLDCIALMARLQTLKPRLSTPPDRLATMSAGSWRSDKQSSTARGYGYKWQQARAGYLKLHPFCAYCLRAVGISYDQDSVAIGLECVAAGIGLPYATVVDHVTAHRGDMKLFWDSTNWAALCSHHHSSTKQREENLAGL